MNAESESRKRDKHILIAVDESESSKRAVLYVADVLGGFPGFTVTLLSMIPEPDEDFFERREEHAAWKERKSAEINHMLDNYREILIQSGFVPDRVLIQTRTGQGASLAEAILETRCDLNCCTVVVGRHHHSRTEEFLFGSTSSKLVREAKNCAVWVIE